LWEKFFIPKKGKKYLMLETDIETYVSFQVVPIPGGYLEIKELARNLEGRRRWHQFNCLFIFVVNSTANGQLQSQHKYKQQQYDNIQ
jgi:hypothetical protein